MRGFVIVAPCNTTEYRWCVDGVQVDNSDVGFFVLVTEFGHEGKIIDPIKGCLDLNIELYESVSYYVLYVIFTVE